MNIALTANGRRLAESSKTLLAADTRLNAASQKMREDVLNANTTLLKENEELRKLLSDVSTEARGMLTQCERQNVLFRSCTANFRECTTRLAETQRADLR